MGSKYLMGTPTSAVPVLFLLLLRFLGALGQAPHRAAPPVPALIFFGDSIVDPGNNNGMTTLAKSNFPPYGKDFVGQQATGRFSNGKIPSDILASKLGIKEYVPAYVGTQLDDQDLITGVSFASGGCGYDPLTSQLAAAFTMDDQLDQFKDYKEKVKAIVGEENAAFIVADSIYAIVTGTDDLANTYFTTPLVRSAEYDLPSYIKFVVQQASNFIQELYSSGARKIAVHGIPPIGCLPSQRTLAGGIERECVTRYNEAAILLNIELSLAVQRLHDALPGSKMVFVDLYAPLLDIVLYPYAYGFEESARGCCGTGTFEVTLTCNGLTTPVCDDVSKYVFWDSFHPTERAYQILINKIVQQYISIA
ncbi:uncharacterized protein M6B38_357325 [Iris pallida]|uniref:GDSL esterase/lipase EXL3 n=1 Tax=Iris pallida TaxID=29817 RepID=A0AAX6G376_IRIPA|nr:uncharacterized protein M6B38_385465 [Iris pallida]KAJ6829556.1 uncharacterized protein M6B38_357325 [Iris pallida]